MKNLLLVLALVVSSLSINAKEVKPLVSVNGKEIIINKVESVKTYLLDAVSGQLITIRHDNRFDMSDLPSGKYIVRVRGLSPVTVIIK